MLETLLRDARHAIRSLFRSPIFTITAVVSLAVAIGATTAIFTLMNEVLLTPPAGIHEPDRVVNVGRTEEGSGFDTFSYPNFADYRESVTTLSGLAAVEFSPSPLSLAGPEGGERVAASIVSTNFFNVLGAQPAMGRFFVAEEGEVPGAAPVVVLSHSFWQDRFSGDPEIVGREIVLNGSPFTVVGVAAEGFNGPFISAPQLWAPVMASTLLGRSEETLRGRQNSWFIAVGRLAPGAEISDAQAELNTIARQLEQAYPESNREQGVSVTPTARFPGEFQQIVSAFMAFLLALSGLVLLVAGTNVAGMLLARGAARRREVAVRLAIGASRRRLLAQFVTESLILFLIAGIAGILLANWLVMSLMALVPRLPIPLALDPTVDNRAVLFALALSIGAGLLAGLFPALQSTRSDVAPELRGDRGGSAGRQRLRSRLLIAQMAFSMLLLVVAGLFARALSEAHAIDPGFDPRGVQVASLDLGLANYEADDGTRFAGTLLDRVRAAPGVQSAALTRMLPLDGGGFGLGSIEASGHPSPTESGWQADWNVVTPEYFQVMKMPLVRGRAFQESDRAGAPEVAIINETLAGRIWPGEEVIGKTFENEDRTITIVGVAADAKYRTLGEDPRAFVYVPLAQRYIGTTSLIVRTAPGVAIAPAIRRIIADLDPRLPILNEETLVEHTAISLFPQKIVLWVAGSLGLVALLLAILGIYGVTAYAVTQRTREIGIRLALGAQRERVLRSILRQGVVLAGVGVLFGVAAALGVTRLLDSMLYGVPAADLLALGGSAGLLMLAALGASWLPARRAANVDPVIALRAE